jgi:hypothetical protein
MNTSTQKIENLLFNSIQFISLSVDPLQGQRPHGYRKSHNIGYIRNKINF